MQATQPPLHLQVAVSRWLRAFIILSPALSALIVLFAPALPWWFRLLVAIALGLSIRHFWCLHISRQHSDAIQEAVFYTVDNWRIHTLSGSKFARLHDSSFIHRWICVLNLRADNGRIHTLILLPDNLPADTLRRLRVRLKFSP